MVTTYFFNASVLCNKDLFCEKYNELSVYRRNKIDSIRLEKAKILSLGAGIILDYGLKKYGLRESQMIYSFGSNNKPYFDNHGDIYFSISHSNDYVMVAFSDTEVGCDIEAVKTARMNIAKRFFCEEEKTALLIENDELKKNELFYRIWTLKESYVKLSGKGLAEEFRQFNVLGDAFSDVNAGVYEYNAIEGYCAACCYQKGINNIEEVTSEIVIL